MSRLSIVITIISVALVITFSNPVRSYASLATSAWFTEAQTQQLNTISAYKQRGITSIPTPTTMPQIQTLRKRVRVTPTPTPTSKPLATSTPRPTRVPTATPTPVTSQDSGLLTSEESYIMKGINDYRASLGLSEVTPNKETCDFAKTRAEEISHGFNHDGFTNRVNSKTLPYPDYSSVTENIAMNSDYKNVTDRWIASAGHAENMRRNTPYVCVKKFGNYYAYEGWKP